LLTAKISYSIKNNDSDPGFIRVKVTLARNCLIEIFFEVKVQVVQKLNLRGYIENLVSSN